MRFKKWTIKELFFFLQNRWMDYRRFGVPMETYRPGSSGEKYASTTLHSRKISNGSLQQHYEYRYVQIRFNTPLANEQTLKHKHSQETRSNVYLATCLFCRRSKINTLSMNIKRSYQVKSNSG